MIKSIKISGEIVPVHYEKDTEDSAGWYETTESSITIKKGLSRDEHDETMVHEMVHALEHLSSLRHLDIKPEVWEIIAGEIGRAVANNFKLIKK